MSTTTPLPLAGKSALVTGAARSIGAEIALPPRGEAPRSSCTTALATPKPTKPSTRFAKWARRPSSSAAT